MKYTKVLLCSLLLAQAVAGGSAAAQPDPYHDLLIPKELCRAAGTPKLTRAQAAADLVVLERLLREGYAGYDVLQKEQGVDWDARFKQARAAVAAMPEESSAEDFLNLLAGVFEGLRDGHMIFYAFRDGGKPYYKAVMHRMEAYTTDAAFSVADGRIYVSTGADVPAGTPVAGCVNYRLADALKPTVLDEGLKEYWKPVVLATAAPEQLKCTLLVNGAERAALFPLRRLKVADKAPVYENSFGDAPVLRYASCENEFNPAAQAFVAAAARVRVKPAFIVDVRGNQGGNSMPVMNWAAGLSGQEFRQTGDMVLRGNVQLQGGVNAAMCRAPEYYAEAVKKLEEAYKERRVPYREFDLNAPSSFKGGAGLEKYQGLAVVIANKDCASTCEELVGYAVQLQNDLLLGENTGGLVHIGSVAPYQLPNSRVFVQLAGKVFTDNPGDPKEGVGYLPDLWLDTDDPVPIAEKISACLADAACAPRLQWLKDIMARRRGN